MEKNSKGGLPAQQEQLSLSDFAQHMKSPKIYSYTFCVFSI